VLLRTRFLLFTLLFVLFVVVFELMKGWIYVRLKEELFERNIALAGNFLGSEAMLMALGLLKVEEAHKERREKMFESLWSAYLLGEPLHSLKNRAKNLGWENPEFFLIDLDSLQVSDSTDPRAILLRLNIFKKMLHAQAHPQSATLGALPRYDAQRKVLTGFTYRYDAKNRRFLVIRADYPSMDREVANVLFYANHILYNFQKRTTIKNLFYHVRYQDATGLEHLAYFDLKSPEKVDHQRALDLAKELSDRALDIPLEESVWYRSSQEEELYLQRKRFSMREGDVDLLLAMGVDRKHYFTHDGYAWFVNGFFWLGMGVFGILFYWLFQSWLLLPIERIAQRMHDKDPIPLSLAGKAKELVTLLETHNRLLEELQKENEFSKMLLDSQDQFIKDSIHDINTPLSVILLNVGLLELEVGENEYLLHIKSGIRSLQHVYGDLSYLLDKEAKEGEGEEVFDLGEVLRERIEFFRIVIQANEKSIFLHIKGEGIRVKMNGGKLKRLIDNNLSNAIKHSFPQSRIDVSLVKLEPHAFLSFSNAAKKIEDKEAIFIRYTKGAESKAGYGIGLSIVKEICDEYGIAIDLSSDVLTTFTYVFPLEKG